MAERDVAHPAQHFLDTVVLPYAGDDCLTWPFARTRNGYGLVWRDGRMRVVSHLVCELTNGPAPSPSHQAAHSCFRGRAGCVNPRHVRWLTAEANSAEMTNGPVTRRKLRDEDVIRIRSAPKSQMHDLAREFGCAYETIRAARRGEMYKHVDFPAPKDDPRGKKIVNAVVMHADGRVAIHCSDDAVRPQLEATAELIRQIFA